MRLRRRRTAKQSIMQSVRRASAALTRSPLLQPLLDRGASHSHSDLDDGPAEPKPAAVFKF